MKCATSDLRENNRQGETSFSKMSSRTESDVSDTVGPSISPISDLILVSSESSDGCSLGNQQVIYESDIDDVGVEVGGARLAADSIGLGDLSRTASSSDTRSTSSVCQVRPNHQRTVIPKKKQKFMHLNSLSKPPTTMPTSIVSHHRTRADRTSAISIRRSMPKLPVFRDLLQVPRNSIQMVKKRTQRAQSILGYHDSFRLARKLKLLRVRERVRSFKNQKSRIVFIPANHPYKIIFDLCIVFLSLYSVYTAHTSIRDRSTYEYTPFIIVTKVLFLIDIILNFFTTHTSLGTDGKTVIIDNDIRVVWARYLTSWFAVDALSFIPWERLYIRPVIEMQNRRNLFVKSFFRTKAVLRVSRFLKGWHLKYFNRVANNSKHIGVSTQRLLQLTIKYVPKYLLFLRNMKGVLIIKALRLIHFIRKAFKAFLHLKSQILILNPKISKRRFDQNDNARLKRFHAEGAVQTHSAYPPVLQLNQVAPEQLKLDNELVDKNSRVYETQAASDLQNEDSNKAYVNDDEIMSFYTTEDDFSVGRDDSWSVQLSIDNENILLESSEEAIISFDDNSDSPTAA